MRQLSLPAVFVSLPPRVQLACYPQADNRHRLDVSCIGRRQTQSITRETSFIAKWQSCQSHEHMQKFKVLVASDSELCSDKESRYRKPRGALVAWELHVTHGSCSAA